MPPGLHLTRDQQIATVRRYGESPVLARKAAGCAGVAGLGVLLFVWAERQWLEVVGLFIAGVCGLVGVALVAQRQPMRRAARATRTGRRVSGVLRLEVDRRDLENVLYTGRLQDGTATWVLQFGNPMGWTPQSGDWRCELVFLSDDPLPALALLDDGLMFPTRQSRRTHGAATRVGNA